MLPAVLLCAACAATPEGTPESDADAKRFESEPRAAVVYLYRNDGSQAITTMQVNQRLLGQSLPASYFRLRTNAGLNRFTIIGPDTGTFDLIAQFGEVYFVAMDVTGAGGHSSPTSTRFRLVEPEIGKAAITRCCSLVQSWRPGQPRFMW